MHPFSWYIILIKLLLFTTLTSLSQTRIILPADVDKYYIIEADINIGARDNDADADVYVRLISSEEEKTLRPQNQQHLSSDLNSSDDLTTLYINKDDIESNIDGNSAENFHDNMGDNREITSDTPRGSSPWAECTSYSLLQSVDACTHAYYTQYMLRGEGEGHADSMTTPGHLLRMCTAYGDTLQCLHLEFLRCPPEQEHLDYMTEHLPNPHIMLPRCYPEYRAAPSNRSPSNTGTTPSNRSPSNPVTAPSNRSHSNPVTAPSNRSPSNPVTAHSNRSPSNPVTAHSYRSNSSPGTAPSRPSTPVPLTKQRRQLDNSIALPSNQQDSHSNHAAVSDIDRDNFGYRGSKNEKLIYNDYNINYVNPSLAQSRDFMSVTEATDDEGTRWQPIIGNHQHLSNSDQIRKHTIDIESERLQKNTSLKEESHFLGVSNVKLRSSGIARIFQPTAETTHAKGEQLHTPKTDTHSAEKYPLVDNNMLEKKSALLDSIASKLHETVSRIGPILNRINQNSRDVDTLETVSLEDEPAVSSSHVDTRSEMLGMRAPNNGVMRTVTLWPMTTVGLVSICCMVIAIVL